MKLTRWQPFNSVFNPLQQFQNEMSRWFERWTNGEGNFAEAAFPALNVWEDTENVCVEAELPGVEFSDLEIYVTGGNQLTIKGERKEKVAEKSVLHRQERSFGTFLRSLTLPFHVDAEKVDARLEQGVLLIKLAKHESAKPRKIAVKAE